MHHRHTHTQKITHTIPRMKHETNDLRSYRTLLLLTYCTLNPLVHSSHRVHPQSYGALGPTDLHSSRDTLTFIPTSLDITSQTYLLLTSLCTPTQACTTLVSLRIRLKLTFLSSHYASLPRPPLLSSHYTLTPHLHNIRLTILCVPSPDLLHNHLTTHPCPALHHSRLTVHIPPLTFIPPDLHYFRLTVHIPSPDLHHSRLTLHIHPDLHYSRLTLHIPSLTCITLVVSLYCTHPSPDMHCCHLTVHILYCTHSSPELASLSSHYT